LTKTIYGLADRLEIPPDRTDANVVYQFKNVAVSPTTLSEHAKSGV